MAFSRVNAEFLKFHHYYNYVLKIIEIKTYKSSLTAIKYNFEDTLAKQA